MKSMNYVGNFNKGQQQNTVMGNTYNPSLRNHPNYSWSNQGNNQWRSQGPPGFIGNKGQQHQGESQLQQEKAFSSLAITYLEGKISKFMDIMLTKMNQHDEATKRLEGRSEQLHQYTQLMFRNHSSSFHNLEVKVGQLANSLSSRNQGELLSNTKKNPKEQVKAITLRSGTKLQPPKRSAPTLTTEEGKEVEKENEEGQVEEKETRQDNSKKKESPPPLKPYEPPVPFP